MNPTITPKRRRRWPWILLAVLLTPIVLVAGAAFNYLTLDRDAGVLRQHVMHATGAKWNTTVQFSIGRPTFAVIRGCFAVIPSEKTVEARQALRAVRSASVGVYQLQQDSVVQTSSAVLSSADQIMRSRGWDRIVGVRDGSSTVMIFVPQNASQQDRICLAVVDGDDLVVVAARLDARALAELIQSHAGQGDWRAALSVSL